MKTAIVFFLLGAIAGAFALHYYRESRAAASPVFAAAPEAGRSLAEKARQTTTEVKESVANKLIAWKLTPDDIKRDLAASGQVVRSKARAAGERISDARIVAVIKAKLVLDSELSALDIKVGCSDGQVTLTGSVAVPDLVGRATALALDTDGVHHVVAKLQVAAK